MSSHSSPTGDGRNAPRSRNGCWTCRTKKVKCDEERPQCRRCLRLKLLCDYAPRRRAPRNHRLLIESRNGSASTRTDDQSLQLLASDWLDLLREHDQSRSLSTFSIAAPETGACSVVFTAADHESVRYFRTSFAKLHHTKNPDYSLYSLMFRIAKKDAIVMHMVLALGGREIEFRRNKCADDNPSVSSPLWHYSSALKKMAAVVGDEDAGRLDLDSVNTALYLMLLYEQKYGDEKCSGVANHLNGASLILQHQCREKLPLDVQPGALASTHNSQQYNKNTTISVYSARLLVWIALLDGAAASCRVGGQLNGTLHKLMGQNTPDNGFSAPLQPLQNFDKLYVTNLAEADKRSVTVEMGIQDVGFKYTELMEVAAELSLTTDNTHRLVANIRGIVPHYYAVVLDFYRLTSTDLDVRQAYALRQIMNLAFQAYKHGGDEAMMRLAWPLYMVVLETDDLLHREWALERMSAISKFGKNFERAHKFLVDVVEMQSRSGKRADVRELLESGEVGLFVI
ncbi:zn 2cys6 transcription factor [Fusarium albosuccineum]|uniref:Zn 2cys6 transcription factor n=1 Tax=Fusarium albosuccineum TaxID=1237068 RepID=A0A8H4LFF3_9HYPO|nr:zn 2cys6 transcription factor [Fusarium albosuccineum]